jgi:hypothetical protein
VTDLIHPMYVDGPILGQDYPVKRGTVRVRIPMPRTLTVQDSLPGPVPADSADTLYPVYTEYMITRCRVVPGLVIFIGQSGLCRPDIHVLVDMMLSDYAKKAMAHYL